MHLTEAELRAALRRVIVLDVSPGDFLPSEDPDWQVLDDAITELVGLRAVLAGVTRLVECEWRDDVPLARLYTLRTALGLTTHHPIDEEMWEADIARNRALLDAALAYGAARESRLAEGRRLRAANYQGDTEEGAAYRALLIAEADAQDALHVAYAQAGGAGTTRGEGE